MDSDDNNSAAASWNPALRPNADIDADQQRNDASAEEASASYEHQGEMTEMEEAVEDAPNAPLLMDAPDADEADSIAPQASMRAVSGASLMSLDGDDDLSQPLPKAQNTSPHIQRSFTTNFTDPPPVQEVREETAQLKVPVDEGWPAVGDDRTFGELLEQAPAAQQDIPDPTTQSVNDDLVFGESDDTFGEMLGDAKQDEGRATPEVQDRIGEEQGKAENIDDVWAALDDDELLDEDQDLDPSTFFGDDDDGFLEDEPSAPVSAPAPAQQAPAQTRNTASAYVPSTPSAGNSPQMNAYGTQSPQFLGQDHGRSAGTPQTGLYDVYSQPAAVQQQPARPGLSSAQSYVDKSKGGYQSPYDLPMDVVKQPRQRPRAAPLTAQAGPTPPPRSSSFTSQQPQNMSRPPTATSTSSAGSVSGVPTAANGNISAKSTPKSDAGFFADLPVTTKARPPRPSGTYTPQPQVKSIPPAAPPQQPPRAPPQDAAPPPPRPIAPPAPNPSSQQSSIYGGLRQPDRLPLLQENLSASQPMPVQPPQNQRYSPSHQQTPSLSQDRFSPAPAAQGPPPVTRYSPAPASQPGPLKRQPSNNAASVPGIHSAYLPRTSSPLAYASETQQVQYSPEAPRTTPSSPPKANGLRPSIGSSPEPIVSPPSELSSATGPPPANASPQRPRTQSPSALMKASRYSMQPLERASSATTTPSTRTQALPHRRQFSRDLNFTPPADERAHDPLERWKGHPIIKWGESGAIITSFPKQSPFWTAGHAIPSVKCTPGPITLQDATAFMPMNERNAKFPGPLSARAKGKKKDVLAWMSGKLEDLERQTEGVRMDFELDLNLKKRTEERLILWKIVKIFVEHDGTLEGDAKLTEEVRAVLLPDLAQMSQVMDLQSPTSTDAPPSIEQSDKSAVLQLRQALLEGQRERAVVLAEDKKLWGHAMLIASTMGPDAWKKTIQNFVRSQVKTAGSDARSLAALYQVFAGNADECADELVPPSARSGHQFVDLAGTKTTDPLAGLDQWRETLGLVAGNRTPNDAQSLRALGRLLSQYSRAEAAHTCFMFARQGVKHSGGDDAEADFALLGSNHNDSSETLGSDLDSILLTEIYEWASSLSAPSVGSHYVPHLQPFKLIHAQQLAASGLKAQAQTYCDHIVSAFSSTTKPSQYYHPSFTQAVGDLSAFLSKTPQSGQQSLLSKIKVSSSASTWFNKFVSGEDDRESNSSGVGGGGEDVVNGPFGRVSGDSPVISRAGSVTDLYNPMMGSGISIAGAPGLSTPPQQFQPSSAPGRYAPGGVGSNRYAHSASGGSAIESRRPSAISAKSYAPGSVQALGVPRQEVGRAVSDYDTPFMLDSRRGSGQSLAGYEPRQGLADAPSPYGYTPPIPEQAEPESTQPDSSFNAPTNGLGVYGYQDTGGEAYAPPTSGYEPPSYQPYEPEPESGNSPPKKQSFMDDDDGEDLAKRAAAMQKAEADRQADEAFKKAAEADAARDQSKNAEKKGGSWFGGIGGGWFKKDANMPQQQPGPIRAKLGEENSFVYDETLKKWVNKKAGAEAAAPVAATPPPPRGPSRVTSTATAPPSGPPSGPPSRAVSGVAATGTPPIGSGPPSRVGTPASMNGGEPPSIAAPPSRPATSMSNASSLDDLLGGPPGAGRKVGGTVKGKKKGGRYVDVMAAK